MAAITETDRDRNYRVGRVLSANFSPAERRQASRFFGGAESTRTQRDRLRAALAASTDAALVADLRFFFNAARTDGLVTAAEVTSALRLLGA